MQFTIGMIGQSLYPGSQKLWWEEITSEEIVRMLQRADELSFDMVRVGEHVVMHEDWVEVMGPRWVDCVSTLAFVAGATKQIKVASAIIVLPYHNPIALAKALATIDYLSDGRLIFTAALGYMEWEYELLKVPFADRGAIMDEYLDAIIELWTSDRPRFDGAHVQFDGIVFDPKPKQHPHPPIWLGGHSKASARRTARVGEGWMPWGITRPQLPEMLEYIKSQPGFVERPRKLDVFMTLFEGEIDPSTHAVVAPPKVVLDRDAILEQVQVLADLGVTTTDADPILGWGEYGHEGGESLPPIRSTEEYLERLQWFAEEILPEGRQIAARDVWS